MAQFTLLLISSGINSRRTDYSPIISSLVHDVATSMWSISGMHTTVLEVYGELDVAQERCRRLSSASSSSSSSCGDGSGSDDGLAAVVLLDVDNGLQNLLEVENENDYITDYIVVVRPDGHVAHLGRYNDNSFREGGIKKLEDEIINGLFGIMKNKRY